LDNHAYENALDQLRLNKHRPAAISAQRALRDAVTTGNWQDETNARRVLASVLLAVGEPELGARHLVRAADVDAIKRLDQSSLAKFIDCTADLDASNYWTVGTTYRLIAAQADLVPDALVERIADHVINEFEIADAGKLIDLPAFAVSRYLGANDALAGIAHRLTVEQARAILAHFKKQASATVDPTGHRDKYEATTVAAVASAHPRLRRSALKHLIPLLARSELARTKKAAAVVDKFYALGRHSLEGLAADGHRWAQEVVAFNAPGSTPPTAIEDALVNLTTPLSHQPGVFRSGTAAVGDSLLVRNLPTTRRKPAIEELLRRADDPLVGSNDRCQYLIAASNLVEGLRGSTRTTFYGVAIQCTTNPVPSKHDEFEQHFSHGLGAVVFKHVDRDTRNRSIFLAACLARTASERAEIRNLAHALLGDGTDSDYWAVRAFQRLGDEATKNDVGSLIPHGWAPRSLAAILWVKYGQPEFAGGRLATDSDVKVRRALARALATEPQKDFHQTVRDILEHDPSYSVRSALHNAEHP
jgi:hypothetical protein